MAEKVVVVGQGYVGLPLALRAAEAGYHVVGLEIDADLARDLTRGVSHVGDVPSVRLRAACDQGRYRATTDCAEADGFDVCVIAVPTPLRDGAPDVSCIGAAAKAVAPWLRPGALVVLESTTYPGTTEELVAPVLEAGSGLGAGRDFHLGYSPERIDPGNPRWTLENTPKVVSGVDAASLTAVIGFYADIVGTVVPVSTTRNAELVKLLENTFRTVNVALINELSIFARNMGIDIWEVIDAAATKPFGFMPFRPGPGVGGHCLPIDPAYLSWQARRTLGRSSRFIEVASDVNASMPGYVVSRLVAGLGARRVCVNGARLLLLGLSYKKNVADLRESPGTAVAAELVRLGADVAAVEPHGSPELDGVRITALNESELAAADAVVVLADHDVFDYELVVRHARYVLDTRARCSGARVERL